MSSPWAKISIPEPTSLQDIMLQEAGKEHQAKENIKHAQSNSLATKTQACDVNQEFFDQVDAEDAIDPNSDAVAARLLQQQFDEEYNILKHIEDKSNGTLKIPVSFDDRHRALQNFNFEDKSAEEEQIEDFHDTKDWDLSAAATKAITEHDITFHTKENKVPTRLKLHRIQDQATVDLILDECHKLQLCEMIKNQMLKRVNHIISIGKTTVILHADSDPAYRNASLPKECAIKVFTLTPCEFNQPEQRIVEDEYFIDKTTDYYSITQNKSFKTNIHLSAKKEMRNLFRLKNAGIPCPKVVALKPYMLIMSFIGENYCSAPKLKNAIMTDDDYISAYNQVVNSLKLLYSKGRLILTDLSEHNIHWHKKQCYFIDVSQAIEPIHYDVFNYLLKDCQNVVNFFTNKGVPNVIEPDDLFVEITGFPYNNKVAMDDAINSFKMKRRRMADVASDCLF